MQNKGNYFFLTTIADQRDSPNPEEIQNILTTRNTGTNNVKSIEKFDRDIFVISLQNKKIVMTTHHSRDENPTPNIVVGTDGVHRCLMVKSNKTTHIPLEFDPSEWFSKKAHFQAEVPNFKTIIEEDPKQGWKELFTSKTITRNTVTTKKTQIIPPFLANSYLEAPEKPETVLSNFLDTLERETEIFKKSDADTLPSSIEDTMRFLFLCINGKTKSTDFTESIIDDDDVDEWWGETEKIFTYTSDAIDDFKSSAHESNHTLSQTDEETNQTKTPDKTTDIPTSPPPGTGSNTTTSEIEDSPSPSTYPKSPTIKDILSKNKLSYLQT